MQEREDYKRKNTREGKSTREGTNTRDKCKVATTIISRNRYKDILFQKVALCYVLHFVQDGCSKKAI